MFILSIDCPPKTVKPILFHFVDKVTRLAQIICPVSGKARIHIQDCSTLNCTPFSLSLTDSPSYKKKIPLSVLVTWSSLYTHYLI